MDSLLTQELKEGYNKELKTMDSLRARKLEEGYWQRTKNYGLTSRLRTQGRMLTENLKLWIQFAPGNSRKDIDKELKTMDSLHAWELEEGY
jgi:hypothetical protein